jgi:hypothetical protein
MDSPARRACWQYEITLACVVMDVPKNLDAELDAYVQKVVDGWPKLTTEQVDNVATLLRAGEKHRA